MIVRLFFVFIGVVCAASSLYRFRNQEEGMLLFASGGAILSLLFSSFSWSFSRRKKEAIQDSCRLTKLHSEYQTLYKEGLKKYRFFHYLTGVASVLGWALFLSGHLFRKELLIRPMIIALYFLFALCLWMIGIKKGNAIDRKLTPIILKGARIEKKLHLYQTPYFVTFAEKKRLMGYLIRFFPLLLIVFPLCLFGLSPFLPFKLEIFAPLLIAVGLGWFPFLPYFELREKFRKLI